MSTGKELKEAAVVSAATELAPAGVLDSEQEDAGAQYLTFSLAGEEYGVEILRVQEIKGWTPVTRIPNTPEYVRGVLNLRGTIVPIIDLRMRFNLEQVEYTPTTVVIVLSIVIGSTRRTLGVVVDGVSDVVQVARDDVKPTPDFGTSVDTDFIRGLATAGEAMVMLLDVDRLLTADELDGLEAMQ
jgi:purine-binding chemotaxis protein CheW